MMYKYNISQLPKPITELFSVDINVHNHLSPTTCLQLTIPEAIVVFSLHLVGVSYATYLTFSYRSSHI